MVKIIRNSRTKNVVMMLIVLVTIIIVAGLAGWILVKIKAVEIKQKKVPSQLLAENWQEHYKARGIIK